jgi:hypothetical protein
MKPGQRRSLFVVVASLAGVAGGCPCVDLSQAVFDDDAGPGGDDAGSARADAGTGRADAAWVPDAGPRPHQDGAVVATPDVGNQPPCFIGGANYPPQAYDPVAYCQKCDPSQKLTDWTLVPLGDPCRSDPGREACTGVCDGFGGCHWGNANGNVCGSAPDNYCRDGQCVTGPMLSTKIPAAADSTLDSKGQSYLAGLEATLEVSTDKSTVIKFDLGALGGRCVRSATLNLVPASKGGVALATRYLLRTGFVESEGCWLRSAAGMEWQTAGAKGINDRVVTSAKWDSLDCTLPAPVVVDVTGEARYWVEHPNLNAGLLLEETASGGGACTFNSRSATDAAKQPMLVVTYF